MIHEKTTVKLMVGQRAYRIGNLPTLVCGGTHDERVSVLQDGLTEPQIQIDGRDITVKLDFFNLIADDTPTFEPREDNREMDNIWATEDYLKYTNGSLIVTHFDEIPVEEQQVIIRDLEILQNTDGVSVGVTMSDIESCKRISSYFTLRIRKIDLSPHS